MNNFWKVIAGWLAGAALVSLAACNNGGGNGNRNNNPWANPQFANPTANLNGIPPGTYSGIISLTPAGLGSTQYLYLEQLLQMQVRSQNFKITVWTDGSVPGRGQMIIRPLNQADGDDYNNYYNQGYNQGYDQDAQNSGIAELNTYAETTAYGGNGLTFTYLGSASQSCQANQPCNSNNGTPDIQINGTVSFTNTVPVGQPTRNGCGIGRAKMDIHFHVQNAELGSGTLCGPASYNRGYRRY